MRVFDYVCRIKKDFRVTDIAKDLDANEATVCNLLNAFVETGYIEQCGATNQYRSTMKIVILGSYIMSEMGLRSLASAGVRDLCLSSGKVVYLSVYDSNQAVIVDIIESKNESNKLFYIGRRNDLYSTSSGKIFLAHMPLHQLEQYLEETDVLYHTPMTMFDSKQIKQALNEVRENGYAIERQESNVGISSVSGPIEDYTGKVVASITVAGPSAQVEHDISSLSQTVLEYCSKISRKLTDNS